jgi:DNA-binding LacI/PurR family transcriptional regulator
LVLAPAATAGVLLHRMSVRRIAASIGVSPATVSMALQNDPKIPAATRRKVQKAADKIGYRRDAKIAELMSHLRHHRDRRARGCFGVISFYDTPRPWDHSLHLARMFDGMKERADALGYRLDPLWLRAPGMTPRRFRGILDARGIEGLLCFGSPRIDEEFPEELDHFAIVSQGLSIRTPLHRVINHAYADTREVLDQVRQRGYRRPGLVLGHYEDERGEQANLSAYLGWCEHVLGTPSPVPVLRLNEIEPKPLLAWLRSHRPDVLVVVHHYNLLPQLSRALQTAGVRVPQDVGIAAVSQILQDTGMAGLEENQRLMGAWAVELLTARIMNRDLGIPAYPRVETVKSRWIDGPSLRAR